MAPPGGSSAGGSGPGAGGAGVGPFEPGGEPLSVPVHRVWRLTPLQYERTFRAAFGTTTKTAADFVRDPRRDGFDDIAPQNHVSISWAEAVHQNAAETARTLAPQLLEERICLGADPILRPCLEQLADDYGSRAYRRPLSSSERTSLVDLFEEVQADGNEPHESVAAVLEAIAQSPYLLYRVEIGEPEGDGLERLDSYTIASQLSYMFTDGPPDQELLDDAAEGILSEPSRALMHAERLLQTPEALEKVSRFFDQYLGIYSLRTEVLPKDPGVYPEYSAALQNAMLAETDRFIDQMVFAREGTLTDLFTAEETFIDDELRAFYGWPGTATPDNPFAIPGGERAGIFMQASVLAARSPSVKTDPLHRGLYIFERLLCQHIAPPPGVDIFALGDQLEPPDPQATERERLEYLVEQHPTCGNCHAHFVSLGLSLENFDAVGAYRETHHGRSIDPSGELVLHAEVGGPYAGAPELFRRIATSAEGQACFAENWLTFAFGDAFSVPLSSRLVAAFRESDLKIQDLLLLATQEAAFYMRRVEEP